MARKGGWADLPVLFKVLAVVMVAAFAATVAGVVGVVKLGEADETGGGIFERNLIPTAQLAEVDGLVNEVRATILRHVVAISPAEMAAREEEITRFRAELDTAWKEYTATPEADGEAALREQLQDAIEEMYAVADEQVLPLSRQDRRAQATKVEEESFDPAFDRVSDALGAWTRSSSGRVRPPRPPPRTRTCRRVPS